MNKFLDFFVTFVSVSERSHTTEGIQITLGVCLSVLFLREGTMTKATVKRKRLPGCCLQLQRVSPLSSWQEHGTEAVSESYILICRQ